MQFLFKYQTLWEVTQSKQKMCLLVWDEYEKRDGGDWIMLIVIVVPHSVEERQVYHILYSYTKHIVSMRHEEEFVSTH